MVQLGNRLQWSCSWQWRIRGETTDLESIKNPSSLLFFHWTHWRKCDVINHTLPTGEEWKRTGGSDGKLGIDHAALMSSGRPDSGSWWEKNCGDQQKVWSDNRNFVGKMMSSRDKHDAADWVLLHIISNKSSKTGNLTNISLSSVFFNKYLLWVVLISLQTTQHAWKQAMGPNIQTKVVWIRALLTDGGWQTGRSAVKMESEREHGEHDDLM